MLTWLKNEITMSGAIQISLPDAEYNRIIDKELNMVYQLYPVAMDYSYTIIPNQVFYLPEFRNNRVLQFPDCVMGVWKFQEMKRRYGLFGINDPDFTYNKVFMADMWMGVQMSGEIIADRTINMSFFDQLQNFQVVDMKFRWNESGHNMVVEGHDPYYNVFCGLYVKAPDYRLFDDPWVRQWIGARCKINVARMIGTFTTSSLLGGVQVNTNLYTEEANREIEECKEQWKMQREANQFFKTSPG